MRRQVFRAALLVAVLSGCATTPSGESVKADREPASLAGGAVRPAGGVSAAGGGVKPAGGADCKT